METIPEVEEPRLIEDLNRWANTVCPLCKEDLCGHQILFSVAMGLKDGPWCHRCLAEQMEQAPEEFCGQLYQHFQHRPCYRRAWEIADEREGDISCSIPLRIPKAPKKEDIISNSAPQENDFWDAGNMGCGDLVLALRGRMLKLPPESIVKVRAHDLGAPEDLPAWCRLTGNRLLYQKHPDYWIERKKG